MSEPISEESPGSDLSLRILWSLARWVEDAKGHDALVRLATSASLSPGDFDGTTRWASLAQIETFLAGAQLLAGDDETFRTALVHRFEESYGAFRHMVWAVSHERVCHLSTAMANKVLTHISRFEALYSTPTTFGLRYTSTRAESRALCLSRQMAWITAPTLRGLPPAVIVERGCIAYGDPHCEYHARWMDEGGLAGILVGLAAGSLAALLSGWLAPSLGLAFTLPLLGASLGYVRELRRAALRNVEHFTDSGVALRTLGEAEAETRSEIVALQQRQHEWSVRMEQQANDRDETLERVVKGLDGLQKSRVSSLRGFSHDLRNPLFVVRANSRLLRDRFAEGEEEGEILDDMDAAALQIESMLGRLMDVATADTGLAKLAPQPVAIAPLVETMRRRLRALVHGRGIEISVTSSPDAPEAIVVDPLVFDRVIDNLLTNAAKYTDRGTISLTFRGSAPEKEDDAGGLVLQLTDTGRGIAAAQIAKIFRPRAANEPRNNDSYGIGLSSAVRLLGQIGGRLEVTSEPGTGSTFVARFPGAPVGQRRTNADEDLDGLIARVVQVRAAS